MNEVIIPSQTIGIIGGGQLGRMMAIEARHMGYNIVVLDPTPNCPTAQVADKQIVATYDDLDAIRELASLSDVVTYEFENVDLEAAGILKDAGLLPQGSYALEITQNREKEKSLMREYGLPVPAFFIVTTVEACKRALEAISYPAVIKTCSGGYDGKGQVKLESSSDKEVAIDFVKQHNHCIIEEWIPYDKEISVVLTRNQLGEITFFPIPENTHKEHILYQSIVPAAVSETVKDKALEAAMLIAKNMNVVGTFAIEMFVVGEDIYINEMAPRPHNSGHYTIEACNISQFAQHIRAICGLPLKEVYLLQPSKMVNILGNEMAHAQTRMAKDANAFVHLYGKDKVKEKRKMGHVTFMAASEEEIQQQWRIFQEASEQ